MAGEYFYDPEYTLSGEAIGGSFAGAGAGSSFGPWGAVIGGVAGGLMGSAKAQEAQEQEQASRELAARTQELSPWTGLRAGSIKKREESKAAATGMMAGLQGFGMSRMGKQSAEQQKMSMEQQQAQTAYMQQATANLKARQAAMGQQQASAYRGQSPYGGGAMGPTAEAGYGMQAQQQARGYMGMETTPYEAAMMSQNMQAPQGQGYSPYVERRPGYAFEQPRGYQGQQAYYRGRTY